MKFSSIFSNDSIKNLKQCDIELQILLNKVAKTGLVNFGVTTGFRSKEEQNRKYQEGKSKVKWPNSKHNSNPSEAADLIVWLPSQKEYTFESIHYCYLAGIILAFAHKLDIPIRWGGNWSDDKTIIVDQDFNDLGHFELNQEGEG